MVRITDQDSNIEVLNLNKKKTTVSYRINKCMCPLPVRWAMSMYSYYWLLIYFLALAKQFSKHCSLFTRIPVVRICAQINRLHVQREAEFGYAETKPQGHQGRPREDEVQSRCEWSTAHATFLSQKPLKSHIRNWLNPSKLFFQSGFTPIIICTIKPEIERKNVSHQSIFHP